MKISLKWLREYVDFDLPADELASRLTQAGLETEGIETVGDDTVIELETTSNRPDHLGHIGVAREVSWICDSPLRLPSLQFQTVDQCDGKSLSEMMHLHVEETDLCPRYTARLAFDARVEPSPAWMQERLEAIGLRPVNNLVDITNYVLFEWGQPLHAFDYDRLEGDSLLVRRASLGEKLTAINDKSYELTREDLVIADGARPIALAGLMGGLETEVTDATRRVLLESAWFDPVTVRTTSRKLVLASDSSYRFERRVDPQGVEWASRRFCQLLQELVGAQVLTGSLEQTRVGFLEASQPQLELRPSRVAQVLGVDIPAPEIRQGLAALGFESLGSSGNAEKFKAPSYRGDVTREIDLVEEVARVYGYDSIPEGELTVLPAPETEGDRLTEGVKTLLTGCGYREALTFSFVEAGEFKALEDWWSAADSYEVRNPMRSPERFLRRSLLPNLLDSLRTNRNRGVEQAALFELSNVFHRQPGATHPRQAQHLAWVCLAPSLDLRDMRGIADNVFRYLDVESPHWVPLAEGLGVRQGAGMEENGRPSGLLGCLQMDHVHEPVWCGELDLGPYLEQSQPRSYQDFSRLPAIRRDLNLVFDEAVSWNQVERDLRELQLPDLIAIDFVDLYRGKQVPAGKKSLTFSLLFRSDERTLTHDEADERSQQAVGRLADRFAAALR